MVVVVVDQMRRSEIDRLGPHFTGGFRRLLNEGARLDGHYGQQNTYTGPGHALILSGSYGYLNGIFQNKWFNRATGRSESMLFDEKAQVINQGPVDPGEDSSPRNFYGSTVGDELRMSNGGKSRVVSLAIKERGALLLGGRTGTAYFFNDLNGDWTTSTYYMNVLPAWLVAFNAKRLADQWFGKEWTRCLPEAVYGPEPDDAPWEADLLGLGRTFPHKITGGEQKPTGKYWEAFTTSPFAIDHTFEFARAAVEGEGLGQDEITDVLAISVSPTDFIRPRVWHLLARGQRLVPPHRSRARRVLHLSRQAAGRARLDRHGDGGSRFGATARARTPARPVRRARQEGRDQDRDHCGTRRAVRQGRLGAGAGGPKRLP